MQCKTDLLRIPPQGTPPIGVPLIGTPPNGAEYGTNLFGQTPSQWSAFQWNVSHWEGCCIFSRKQRTLGTMALGQPTQSFQGENIINTHLISLEWPLRVFPCAVTTTTQGKTLREAANGYRKQSDAAAWPSMGMRVGKC